MGEISCRGLRVLSVEGTENEVIDADYRRHRIDLRLQPIARSRIAPLDALVDVPMLVSIGHLLVHAPRHAESMVELKGQVAGKR